MHYSDLSLSTQLGLISLIGVLSAGFFAKALVFCRHESAGLRPLSPDSWNPAQCQTLERLRLLIGLGLIPLWAVYLLIDRSAPPRACPQLTDSQEVHQVIHRRST